METRKVLTSNADAEVVAILLADVPHEISRMRKATLDCASSERKETGELSKQGRKTATHISFASSGGDLYPSSTLHREAGLH